jgi:hypothetical protein
MPMKRLLVTAAKFGSAAAVLVGTLWLAVSQRDGTTEAAPVLLRAGLVQYLVARDGYLPPVGQCWPVEVALLGDEDDAGMPVATQTAWQVCDLDDGTWVPSECAEAPCPRVSAVDGERRCRARARELCELPAPDTGVPSSIDAGAPEPEVDRRCAREAEQVCVDALRSAGGPVWHGEARAAVVGTDVPLKRLSRRALMESSCGCANARDAGVCRERIVGADAGPWWRVVPPGGKCALGLCQGPGCVPAPCTHSEARERCGGGGNCLEPEECQP